MSRSLGAILFLTSSVGLKFITNWCTMRIYSSTYVYRLNVFFFGYCEQTRHRTTKFDHSLESLGCKLSIVRWIIVLAFVSVDIFWINVDTRGNWHLPKNGRKLKYLFTGLKSQISNGVINNWIKSDWLKISQHFKRLNVSKIHVEFSFWICKVS